MEERRVPVSWLRVGVFVRLKGLKWYEHPFVFPNFKIESEEQIETIRGLGLKDVEYDPARSDVLPQEPDQTASGSRPVREVKREVEERGGGGRKAAEEKYRARAKRMARVEKEYGRVASEIGAVLNKFTGAALPTWPELEHAGEGVTRLFSGDQESAMLLVNSPKVARADHLHAMNVSFLSMALARKAAMGPSEIRSAGLAGLLHDVGKTRLDRKVFMKSGMLTTAEKEYASRHPGLSAEIVRESGACSPEVIRAVHEHHERFDGGGYPAGLKGAAISPLGRVLAIVNAYDNLCNPPSQAEPLTPFEALATMFAQYRSRYDETYLALFIHCLGIYPPGTLVELSNGSMGLVVSNNPENQLAPSVLVPQDGEEGRQRAVVLNLGEEKGLTISKSVRPTAVPEAVLKALSSAESICYFVDPENPGAV